MANKTISELNSLSTVSDNDVLLIETDTETMKITKSNLFNDYVTLNKLESDLSTKSDLEHTHTESEITDLKDYATTTDLSNGLSTKSDLEHTHDVSDITNLSIPTKTSELTNDSSYATENFVSSKISEAQLGGGGYGGSVDLSSYATKDDLNTKADVSHTHSEYLTSVPSEYITGTELIAKGYATVAYVDQQVSSGGTSSGSSTTVYSSYVSPSETNDDIQSAINLAVKRGCNHVILEGKTYSITSSIVIPSRFTIEGVRGSSVIEMTGVDAPVITNNSSSDNKILIENLTIKGDTTLSNNDGIKLVCYYSTVKGVEVRNCGGKGIYFHTKGSTSTLVENRIQDCVVAKCIGTHYQIGNSENNKLTDGFFIHNISDGSKTNQALQVLSCAGWQFNGFHTYGHGYVDRPIDIRNAFNTIINNFYIEDFKGRGISCTKIQKNLIINNIMGNIKTPYNSYNDQTEDTSVTQKAIYLAKSSTFTYRPNITLSNIAFDVSNTGTTYVVDSDGSKMAVSAFGVTLCGNNFESATIYSSNVSGKVNAQNV